MALVTFPFRSTWTSTVTSIFAVTSQPDIFGLGRLPLALVIFFLHGDVDIWMGLVLAVGNMIGALIGTKIAVKGGAKFIRYFVLVAILGAATKMIIDAVKAL